MDPIVKYPDFTQLDALSTPLREYARLKCEQGAETGAAALIGQLTETMRCTVRLLQELPDDAALSACEPNELDAIRALRAPAQRRLWEALPPEDIWMDKLEGALLGRIIGCLLGVPVEGLSVESMRAWSEYIGKPFPPVSYWEEVQNPELWNCYGRQRGEYRKCALRSAPVDDDLAYTQLALMILEEYGPDFTTEDVGEAWKKYLPVACTAEQAALDNLKKGVPAWEAADRDNPFCQWIGAAIRSDGFGWAAAGLPELAAEMAWRDARLSHRRNGIYGEMFLAAAQSAAFAVSDPLDAVRAGMAEIPRECLLYRDLAWALEHCGAVRGHGDARRLVDERFAGMHAVHTNNNLCLIVFGLKLAEGDLMRGLSQTVAMGLDSDCTAASAGSILGAVLGKRAIAPELYECFHDRMDTYLKNTEAFSIRDMAKRYSALAHKVHSRL